MRPEFVQGEWARALASALASGGVTDVIVSPGSRSTPVLLAALEEPRLHVLSAWDERAASFFALGMSRRSGRPTVVLRTSGSAAGHDLPAVMEADAACVPLVVLSADRPPELIGSGASQTADQLKLFGDKVRAFCELGLSDPEGFDGMSRKVAQVLAAARGPVPGPVHLNAPFRKPLEPTPAVDAAERSLADRVTDRTQRPTRIQVAGARFGPAAFATAAEVMLRARRGLLVAGPSRGRPPLEAVERFLEATDFCLAAEVASGLTPAGGLEAFERQPPPEAPDVVVSVGAQPCSRALQGLVRRAEHVLHLDPWQALDPFNRAGHVFVGPLEEALVGLLRAVEGDGDTSAAEERARFKAAWTQADRLAAEGLSARFDAEPAFAHDGTAARRVLHSVPEGALLVLGNSLAVRLVDRFGRPGLDRRRFEVATQRGLAGIDGNISAALGSALEHGGPTVALLGDVAFAHDLNGLAFLSHAEQPFVLCLLDNGGGRIFDELPVATSAPEAMPYFRTPTGLDVEAACRAFGVVYLRFDHEAVLREALATPGAKVLHAKLQRSAPDE